MESFLQISMNHFMDQCPQLNPDRSVLSILACMRRLAYGGQVLFARPEQSPHYQFYVMMSPQAVRDREISSASEARTRRE